MPKREEMIEIPEIAISVRQPWAWAIVAGHKSFENRSAAAVRHGLGEPARRAIHASRGMTRAEYESAAAFMASVGVTCPLPAELERGGIVGVATVEGVVDGDPSPWFFGPRALVLSDAVQVPAIPSVGALGLFRWQAAGELATPAAWMVDYSGAGRAPAQGLLGL